MERVVVLNSDYSFLNVVSWQKAIKMIVKKKVEVIKQSLKKVRNGDKTIEMLIPKVLRLIKMVRTIYRTRVPFSKKNVLVRDKYSCKYCGTKEGRLTIDHVIPKSQGGKSSFENCVTSCKPCNNTKDDRTPSQAKMFFVGKPPWNPTIMEFLNIKMEALGVDELLRELGVY